MSDTVVQALLATQGFQLVRWCRYHDAQIVNDRDQVCWDAEPNHDCVPVDAVLAIGDGDE